LAGRHEEALASAENAIKFAADYARGWSNRGDALFALEQYKDALDSYETALILEPGLTDALEGKEKALAKI
jgi:tetratricopeptide (TPR) repeat protein